MSNETFEQSPSPEQQEIAELKEKNRTLAEESARWESLALRDFLTEVYNRRGLEAMVKILLPAMRLRG